MLKLNRNSFVLFVCLLILIIPSHIIGIDKFVTYDEPWWVISGSNYYYALTHKDFENTIYDYHPAVTTTWMVTAGMLSYFPEYRGFGQGYFDVRKPLHENFLREHGREPIDLIRNSRLIQTAVLIILLGLSFYLLQLLVDQRAAFLSIALLSLAPFYLGISRLLNHEGLLSTFVLVSLLAMQVYLNKDRKLIYLLISGAAFGLAQLTKSSSIALLPLIGLMLLVELFKKKEDSWGRRIFPQIKHFLIWLGMAVFVYVLLWPGMWVAPGKMLYEVYGNAFSYAFQGARLDVTGELQPAHFNLSNAFSGIMYFFKEWAVASTWISWLGLILAFVLLAFRETRSLITPPVRSTLVYFSILGTLFMLMFGIAQGRNASYYILSSFVAFDVIAGLGWGYLLLWLQEKWSVFGRTYIQVAMAGALIGLQLASGLPYYPYYINYENPFLAQRNAYGYGIGLELAADYLAQKPDAEQNVVYVYLGMGSFSYFYPGESKIFKKAYLLGEDLVPVANDMRLSDYLVVYSAVQNREPESRKFMDALKNVQPEKIIYINGIEYDRIYKISDIPESVYEILNQ